MFGALIARTLPLVPKSIVGRVARRYIAGEALPEAVATVRALNDRGFAGTVDVLGEEVHDTESAAAHTRDYCELVAALKGAGVRAGVSLKLTQFGLRIDRDLCMENLRQVLDAAHAHGRFVRIDMEDSSLTTVTLDAYRQMREERGGERLGVVLQSYLYRTEADVEAFLADPPPADIRLCKGIYREPPDRAFTCRELITQNFIRLAKRLLGGGARLGIATHDKEIIEALAAWVRSAGIPTSQYEFQALLGVPIEGILDGLVKDGHRVRVYVPYGSQWYAYSTRRLKENPEVASHVFKAMFRRLD